MQVRFFDTTHFNGIVLRARNSTIPLKKDKMESLRRKRQRYEYIDLLRLRVQADGDLSGRRHAKPSLPREITDERA